MLRSTPGPQLLEARRFAGNNLCGSERATALRNHEGEADRQTPEIELKRANISDLMLVRSAGENASRLLLYRTRKAVVQRAVE